MDKKNYAIFLVLLTTLLTSTAQLFYKYGIVSVSFDFLSMVLSWQIIFGIFLYAVGAVILIIALRYGEVSVLYPIIATSYIWVSIGSSAFFNEIMNMWKWLGVSAIVVGVVVISYGSRNIGETAHKRGVY